MDNPSPGSRVPRALQVEGLARKAPPHTSDLLSLLRELDQKYPGCGRVRYEGSLLAYIPSDEKKCNQLTDYLRLLTHLVDSREYTAIICYSEQPKENGHHQTAKDLPPRA